MEIGTPLKTNAQKVLMLGSGELGKEVVMELMRLGAEVIACDSYKNAPAMQVAHRFHIFDMLDGKELRRVIETEQPDLVVPEVEAIATQTLLELENEGFNIIPTANATHLTMDREGIRNLASKELGLKTAKYCFADNFNEFSEASNTVGYPFFVKPIMSSSGKGQSIVKSPSDLQASWDASQAAGRAGAGRVICEEFLDFKSEITLLTLRSINGTSFCDPIGHLQKDGDYIQSWQPHAMSDKQIDNAQKIAKTVTDKLGGYGIFGVELFLMQNDEVIFSEVSPRPHDTGMVTMITQTWSEFALHARAILGLPITQIHRHSAGASVALKADKKYQSPTLNGAEKLFALPDADLRYFGKPDAKLGRRLAVVLARSTDPKEALQKALKGLDCLTLTDG